MILIVIEKAFKIKQKIERHVIPKKVCNKLFFKKDTVFIFKGLFDIIFRDPEEK